MNTIASGLGTRPLLRKRQHLFSCREAPWLLPTSLVLTNTIWFLLFPTNRFEYQYPFTAKDQQCNVTGSLNALLLQMNIFIIMINFHDVQFFCISKPCLFPLQHKPPLEVNDLFEDIKDGVKLLALLEVLSGQRLVSSTYLCTGFKYQSWIH